MHPLVLEADEMQDYPEQGWIELIETLKRGSKGAQWRCHGVSRGVRDRYYKQTQPESGWTVHRFMGMHRPNWTAQERQEKIDTYTSRDSPDYRRNIYGEHGDATNPLFVLARLMACVDQDRGSEYNVDVYAQRKINYELLQSTGMPIEQFLADLPGSHKIGYSGYYAGMDVGFTNHPSEILVFGQVAGKGEVLKLLTRVQLARIDATDQMTVIDEIFRFYGPTLRAFAMDKTGNGLPIWQQMLRNSPQHVRDRIKGYNFSAKYAVEFEDREMEKGEKPEDLVVERGIIEYTSDKLREYVDSKRLLLPFDQELLSEWQGQSYTVVKSAGSPYGKREYSKGKMHTLDAGKMMIAAKTLENIEEILAAKTKAGPVLDSFGGF